MKKREAIINKIMIWGNYQMSTLLSTCVLTDFPDINSFIVYSGISGGEDGILGQEDTLANLLRSNNRNICLIYLDTNHRYRGEVFHIAQLKTIMYNNIIVKCKDVLTGIPHVDNVHFTKLYSKNILTNNYAINTSKLEKLVRYFDTENNKVYLLKNINFLKYTSSLDSVAYFNGNTNVFDEAIDIENSWYCGTSTSTNVYDDIVEVDITSLNMDRTEEEKQEFLRTSPELCNLRNEENEENESEERQSETEEGEEER